MPLTSLVLLSVSSDAAASGLCKKATMIRTLERKYGHSRSANAIHSVSE